MQHSSTAWMQAPYYKGGSHHGGGAVHPTEMATQHGRWQQYGAGHLHPGQHIPAVNSQQPQQSSAAQPVPGVSPHSLSGAQLNSLNASDQDFANDALKAVRDLPSIFQPLFSFRYFNPVQSECFDMAYKTDTNMVVSAPTGAGKTGVMELAILRLLSKHLIPSSTAATGPSSALQEAWRPPQGRHKSIYLGPIKALVQERQEDWQARFGATLGLNCVQLTGDVNEDQIEGELETADIICSTPEKFDQVTRKVKGKGGMGFFAEVALVLVDEVHLLDEGGRGSSLEAGCVCRIKAMATFPEMKQAPIAHVRFVAVSATIPNIRDIATWLAVPPAGIRQYGDELRPCKLTTHVKGYAPAKNDFLFERRLNEYVYTIVTEYSKGRPSLVFCNSRKGTMDTAATLVKDVETRGHSGSSSSAASPTAFVKNAAQQQRLQAAGGQTRNKALAATLAAGVGFHNAAMEPADRVLVEELFKANDLAVLCTTSTLAVGVNLPAHLVVIKGTTRYVGDQEVGPGEAPGYKEYTQTEVLQMVGRAGRPRFDTEGVAVIMTSRDNTHRYQRLLAGQAVESCLMTNLAEHLNAEVVLETVKDVPGAINWLKSTFLYTRVRANPQHYGLRLQAGMHEADLDNLVRNKLLMQPMSQLLEYGLLATDEDSFSLTATEAGQLMAGHFLKLRTMASIIKLGKRPNMPSLLRVICAAEEFRGSSLRRSEKKVLNELNHSKDPQQLRYHVMANREGSANAAEKVKERIGTAQEKLFLLLNDGLADKPSDSLDYSLKQEQDRLLVVGQRIAKCMARYYVLQNSFSAAGRSVLLARSLKAKMWDDSSVSVRQLPSVGKLLGARLAAAGLGSLQAIAACADAHKIEVAAQRPYPWGSELLAKLRSVAPPPVRMQLQMLHFAPNRAITCQLTITRLTPAEPAQGNHVQNNFTTAKVLCGCSNTDQLLLIRSLVLETFESPQQLQFRVDQPADSSQPLSISARLLLDRLVGLDEKVSMTVPAANTPMAHSHGSRGHYAEPQSNHRDANDQAEPACQQLGNNAAEQGQQDEQPGQPSKQEAGNKRLRDSRGARGAVATAQEACGNSSRYDRSMPAPKRGKHRLQHAAQQRVDVQQLQVPGAAVATAGNDLPRQPLQELQHNQQLLSRIQSNHCNATAGLLDPTGSGSMQDNISHACMVPQTEIAARYCGILGLRGTSQLQAQSNNGKSSKAHRANASSTISNTAPADACTDAPAAMDAAHLQVTPEHSRAGLPVKAPSTAKRAGSSGMPIMCADDGLVADHNSCSQPPGPAVVTSSHIAGQRHGSTLQHRQQQTPRMQDQGIKQQEGQQQAANRLQGHGLPGGEAKLPGSAMQVTLTDDLSMSSMFEMLTDEPPVGTQHPPHPLGNAGQQHQGTADHLPVSSHIHGCRMLNPRGPTAAVATPATLPHHTGVGSTARGQAALGQATTSAATKQQQVHCTPAGSASSVFGAAVLQGRRACSDLLASSSIPKHGDLQSSGIKLQTGGKGSSSGIGKLTVDPGAKPLFSSQPPGLPEFDSKSSKLQASQPAGQQQVADAEKWCRQHRSRRNSSLLSIITGDRLAVAANHGAFKQPGPLSAQLSATHQSAQGQAQYASSIAEKDELRTPPRQIRSSGLAPGPAFNSSPNSLPASQYHLHNHQQHEADADAQPEDEEQHPSAAASPDTRQFAFGTGTTGAAPQAAFNPLPNTLLFLQQPPPSTRAQASQRQGRASHVAGNYSSMAARLHSSGGSSISSTMLEALNSTSSASAARHSTGPGQLRTTQQHLPAESSPGAPKMPGALHPWGTFVDPGPKQGGQQPQGAGLGRKQGADAGHIRSHAASEAGLLEGATDITIGLGLVQQQEEQDRSAKQREARRARATWHQAAGGGGLTGPRPQLLGQYSSHNKSLAVHTPLKLRNSFSNGLNALMPMLQAQPEHTASYHAPEHTYCHEHTGACAAPAANSRQHAEPAAGVRPAAVTTSATHNVAAMLSGSSDLAASAGLTSAKAVQQPTKAVTAALEPASARSAHTVATSQQPVAAGQGIPAACPAANAADDLDFDAIFDFMK